MLKKSDEFSTGAGKALRLSAFRTDAALPLLGPPAPRSIAAPSTVPLSAAANAASTKVKEALATQGPVAAATELEVQVQSLTPEQAKEVYTATQPIIDDVLQKLEPLSKADTEQVITSLAHAARIVGPQAVTELAGRLAAIIPTDGKVGEIDDALVASIHAGAGPDLALATAAALRASGNSKGADAIDKALVDGVDQLREEAKSAGEKKAELDTRLAQDMASFGGTLTPEERQNYETQFWAIPEHAQIKATATSSSDALARTLEVAGPQLEAMARAGNEGAGEAMLDAYEVIAKDPAHAEQALTFAKKLGNDPELFKTIDGFINDNLETRLSDGLMTDATVAVQQQLLAKYGDSPDGKQQLLADMKRIFGDFKGAKAFKTLGTEVGKFLDDTERFANGSPEHLDKIVEGWDSKSKFGKAAAVFTVVAGLYGTGKALSDGHYVEALKKGLGASAAGLQITAGILTSYAGAARLAPDASKFIGRFAPGLGMVLDAVQLGQDINELRNDPNAGEIVKAIGTLVQLGGDVAGYVPVLGTAVDGVLTIAGTIIHGIGGFIDSMIEGNDARDKLQKEQSELYAKVTGVPLDQAKEIISAKAATIQRLTQLGLSPAQIRTLAAAPNVNLNDAEAATAIKTAALFGLDAKETVDFVKMAVGHGEFQYVDNPLTSVYSVLFNPVTGMAQADDLYQRHNLGPVQDKVLEALGYRNPELAAYLKGHRGMPDWDVTDINTIDDIG